MYIYCLRHTKVNVHSNICYGKSDVELDSNFISDFIKIKSKLEQIEYQNLYSSPLKRCTKLADFINNNYIIDQRIIEINFGDWELKNWNDINDEYSKKWMNNWVETPSPNGESLKEMIFRVHNFINDIKLKKENCLIITHSGVIRCIYHIINNTQIKDFFKFNIEYGELIKFEVL